MKTLLSLSLLAILAGMSIFLLSGCRRPHATPSAAGTAIPPMEDDLTWWTPEPGQSWQVQYDGEIDLSLDVDIYNLDLFETTWDAIQTLHARGIRVICYLNAGAWENDGQHVGDHDRDEVQSPPGDLRAHGRDQIERAEEQWAGA